MNGTEERQRGRILSPFCDRKGYLMVKVCVPGLPKRTVRVHRLVAEAFIGPVNAIQQVNHINGDKADNNVANLEYVTCRTNIQHAWETGLCKSRFGERGSNAKLSSEDVSSIRATHPAKSLGELARTYGVSKRTISDIVKRKTWVHLASSN